MKITLIILSLLCLTYFCNAQAGCNPGPAADTLYIPSENKLLHGESIQATLKNKSVVKLFKTPDSHYYLKIFITRNFYFNKVDMLEIRSGSKSYYAKDTKQYKLDKTTGMFVLEIFRNYVATLKDEGITSVVFAKAETDFTKKDAALIKQISQCFYESIGGKK
jgi:hypothetical protein